MPVIRLHLLGPFRVEGGSGPIHLSRRKAASLLAYLVLHPEPHLREELATLFWGDFPDAQARHSLRTSLADLRRELSVDLILLDRETVQFNPNHPLWVDSLEFKSHLSTPDDLEIAVSLYQGDLLADSFEDWITPEREHYRGLFLEALSRLTQDMRASSEYERAIGYAQKILACDPANERAHQHLMFCYLATGYRNAALKQFEKCEQVLRDEFALEPKPETIALFQWIKQASAQPRSQEARLTNLPIPLTSFIGRKREIAEARRLLTASHLVTLTGAGGSGKTRLAIQVATDLVDAFKDGVWWVDLAGLTNAELVPAAVARALGVHEVPYQPLGDALVASVGPRPLLLVLDNCEHLVAACRQVVALMLGACPNLSILTTSREALGITGEIAWLVPTLTLPDPAHPAESESWLQYEGIRLFNERAMAVNHDFALTSRNLAVVTEICRRLDGIPLAIELAAARTKVLSVEQIAERLDDRLNLLTVGSRTALPRQQTLRAAIDWSHNLLTPTERALFRRLAVFAGGFTLQAAESIWPKENPPTSPSDSPPLLEVLSQLVDKSLVSAEPRGGENRYHMLDTIRHYALEKLSESGEAGGCRDRHLDFFLQLAESAEPYLTSADREVWLERLEIEHDNSLAALEWSQGMEADVGPGLRLAGALYWFWYYRGFLSEGRAWLERAVARAEVTAPSPVSAQEAPDRAQALFALARLTHAQGDNAAAKPLLEESITLWRLSSPMNKRGRGLAHALIALAWLLRDQGDPAGARALSEEGVGLFREQGDRWGVAFALISLGMAMRDQEQFVLARAQIQEGVSIFRELGDELGSSDGLHSLGLVAYRQGEYEEAYRRFDETLAIRRKLGIKSPIAYALHNLGLVRLNQGDAVGAKHFFEQSEALFRELGDKFGTASCLLYYGHLAMYQDDVAAAQAFYTQALVIARRVGPTFLRGLCMFGLAGVAAVQSQPERAARLWGAAEVQMAEGSSFFDAADRGLYDRSVAGAGAQLGDEVFEALRAEGKAMALDQAIEYALRI
ncbi:MAG: tetratricopeptide repeat protein [Anaerolineales bacterium]